MNPEEPILPDPDVPIGNPEQSVEEPLKVQDVDSYEVAGGRSRAPDLQRAVSGKHDVDLLGRAWGVFYTRPPARQRSRGTIFPSSKARLTGLC